MVPSSFWSAPKARSRNPWRLLCGFIRSEKFFGSCSCRETTKLFIVGIVLRRVRGAQHDEVCTILLDEFGQVVTFMGRHIPCPTMWALIVAHAGPFVGPPTAA